MAEPLKAAILVVDTLARQSTETSEFASALEAIYRARYTGAAVLHFRYGEPKMIEFATTQIRLDNGRKHRPA